MGSRRWSKTVSTVCAAGWDFAGRSDFTASPWREYALALCRSSRENADAECGASRAKSAKYSGEDFG